MSETPPSEPTISTSTSHQHYVPRFYLRRFGYAHQPGTKPGMVYVFTKRTGVAEPKSTAEAGGARDYYRDAFADLGDEQWTDEAITRREVQWARAVACLLTDGKIPPDTKSRRVLAEFVAWGLTRSPRFRSDMDRRRAELHALVPATHPQAGKLGPEALAGLQGAFLQDHTERVQKIPLDRRWQLWSNPDPTTPLWTGGSPVVHWRNVPAGPEFGTGLGKSRTQIVVPLDPLYALWIEAAPRKRPLPPGGVRDSPTPESINQLVLRSAERELYAPSDDFAAARADLARNPSWSNGGIRGPTGHDPREVIINALRPARSRRRGR